MYLVNINPCCRARRRRARENKNIMGHHDGVSSDDEENQSEIMKFNQERGGDLCIISSDR